VGQITLVAYKHDGHVGVGMLPCILQPACQVVESLSPAFGLLLISYGANKFDLKNMQLPLKLWNTEIQYEIAPGDVIYQQCTCRSSVVRSGDRPKWLLPSLFKFEAKNQQ
jgi:hypothetical protein